MSAAPKEGRGTGWGVTVVLALLAAAFSVVNPALLIFVPLAFLLVAMPPRRPMLTLLGLILLGVSFIGEPTGSLWWFARGWTLMLSAWFVVTVALLREQSLTMRVLSAVGGATASAALLFLGFRGSWEAVDWSVTQQLRNGAADLRAFWTSRLANEALATDLSAALDQFAGWQSAAYPAMLALASIAALTLAWWLWRRLALQDPRPLGRLRDFRFSDHLVWIVVAGILLVVMPWGAALTRVGANLLAFMAALYALRGFAVLVALFGVPGFLGMFFGAFIFLMLYPIVMAMTLMVGLTDTWLDLRKRNEKPQSNP